MKVEVKGCEELIAKLKSVTVTKAKAAIRKGCRTGSKYIAAQVKQDAPDKSGALRGAVKVRALPRSRKYVGTVVRLEIRYGSFVDLGTKHLKAKHFMKQAAKDNNDAVVSAVITAIKEELINKA